jgi:HD-GYP domain-containing protein (c-di-GMP phosphodiesterase class II)
VGHERERRQHGRRAVELDDRVKPSQVIGGRLHAAAEGRYHGIAAHTDRMSLYVEVIARALGISAARARLLRGAAKLHDIGKIAIPDRILLKPGPLTRFERSVIERHPIIGHDLLRGSDCELLDVAASIALSHHERWDGSGYPHGLCGERIPAEARIAAVADVFDSLTRNRSYRPALRIGEALRLVRDGSGTQFDPGVVDAFFAEEMEIRRVRRTRT